MVIKRTFVTKLEPVDAFGLANELLRPRGFTLDKGSPTRSQQWKRGVEEGKKAKSIFQVQQVIEVEFDRGRANVTATAAATGRKGLMAQRMMTAYAEAIEKLMVTGETPAKASKGPRRAESAIRGAILRRNLSVCAILFGVLGGAAYAMTTMKNIPSPMKWISPTPANQASSPTDGKSKKGSPVVVVRKAGAQTNATQTSDSPP